MEPQVMRAIRKVGQADPNVTAFNIVQAAADEAECADNEANELVNEGARKGGLPGGKARAERLSKKERTAIAKKAAQARWAKQ